MSAVILMGRGRDIKALEKAVASYQPDAGYYGEGGDQGGDEGGQNNPPLQVPQQRR